MKKVVGYSIIAVILFFLGIATGAEFVTRYWSKSLNKNVAANCLLTIFKLEKIREGKIDVAIGLMENEINTYARGLLYEEKQLNDYSKLANRFKDDPQSREFIKRMHEYRVNYPQEKSVNLIAQGLSHDVDKIIEFAAEALK